MHRRLVTLRNQNTRCRGDSMVAEMAVQLQKNLLRQFLGYAAVVQKVVSQAENHALLLPNDVGERGQIALRRRFGIFPHANCCSSRANRCHALLIDILRAARAPECSIFTGYCRFPCKS